MRHHGVALDGDTKGGDARHTCKGVELMKRVELCVLEMQLA
jgi:hypothetical protein